MVKTQHNPSKFDDLGKNFSLPRWEIHALQMTPQAINRVFLSAFRSSTDDIVSGVHQSLTQMVSDF